MNSNNQVSLVTSNGEGFYFRRHLNGDVISSTVGKLRYDPETDGGLTRQEGEAWNFCIDGLEAMLLAMFYKGVDLTTPEMKESFEEALYAIGNHIS